VIVVAGTAGGADTAVVATAAPSTGLTRLRIHEIICKPLLVSKKGATADQRWWSWIEQKRYSGLCL